MGKVNYKSNFLKSLLIVKYFFVFIFLSLSIITLFFEIYSLDFLLLFLFISLLLLDLYLYPKKFFLNLLIYLTIFFNIIGVFFIEYSTSFYLYEVEQWTQYAGSIPLLLLVQFAFLQGIYIVINEKRIVPYLSSQIVYKNAFLFLLIFLLTFTYIVIFIYKPAPILGVDRFIYDKLILGPLGRITNLLFYFSLGLGILFFKEKKKIYLMLLILIEIAFFLKGHKFWNFVQILFLFFLPYVFFINRKKIIKALVVFFFGISIFIFSAIKINLYYFPSFKATEYIKQRLAQEGQLWWSTYLNYPNKIRIDEAIKEVETYFELNEDNKFEIGMYKVMQLNTTPKRFKWKIAKLSRYVYSTPALIYYYFGSIGVVLLIYFFGILWGLWLKLALYIVNTGNLLASILVGRLFYILRKVVKDGDIYKLFSLEIIAILAMLSLLILINIKKERNV